MSVFGDIERFLADIYPYRWPIIAAILVAGAAALAYGYRSGWHLAILRRWKVVAVVATPVLVLIVLGGWRLAAPLFTDMVVDEEFPFDLSRDLDPSGSAVVARDESVTETAKTTAGVAKVDVETTESSPDTPSARTTVGKAAPDIAKLTTDVGTTPVTEVAGSPTVEPAAAAPSTPTDAPTPVATPISEPSDANELAPTPEAIATPDPEPDAAPEPTATAAPEPIPTVEPTATPSPEPTAEAVVVALKTGGFHDADSFHKGSGQATIFRGPDGALVLRLEDFKVTNGPDLHVYLSPHRDPENPGQVKGAGYVDLGELKGNVGNQNYFIPADADVDIQGSVVIYCVPFSVIFSVATLE